MPQPQPARPVAPTVPPRLTRSRGSRGRRRGLTADPWPLPPPPVWLMRSAMGSSPRNPAARAPRPPGARSPPPHKLPFLSGYSRPDALTPPREWELEWGREEGGGGRSWRKRRRCSHGARSASPGQWALVGEEVRRERASCAFAGGARGGAAEWGARVAGVYCSLRCREVGGGREVGGRQTGLEESCSHRALRQAGVQGLDNVSLSPGKPRCGFPQQQVALDRPRIWPLPRPLGSRVLHLNLTTS